MLRQRIFTKSLDNNIGTFLSLISSQHTWSTASIFINFHKRKNINTNKYLCKSSDAYRRCKRLQSVCDPRDYKCLLLPEQYTYQYITLVSNLPLSHGHIQLFQIKGPQWIAAKAEFSMKLLEVNCPYKVQKVDDSYFQKITDDLNTMALYLIKPIQGPQEIKLQIEMRLFRNNIVIGNAIVYMIIVVSEHTFWDDLILDVEICCKYSNFLFANFFNKILSRYFRFNWIRIV